MIGAVEFLGRRLGAIVLQRPEHRAGDRDKRHGRAAGQHFAGQTRDARSLGPEPQRAPRLVLAGVPVRERVPLARSRSPLPPVSSGDADGLLVIAAQPKLGGGEQTIDDVVVLADAIIDELAVALAVR